MRSRIVWLSALASCIFVACAADPGSVEDQIRRLLADMETAAEAKDLGALKDTVSERYSDEAGNDRRAIVGLLTYHFLRNQGIHLFTRVASIESREDGSATARAFVAMAGQPIADASALVGIRANLYRFDFEFEPAPDGWRLTRAAWRPAQFEDFR